MSKPIIPVLLRVWRDDSTPFAMFPTLPGTNQRFTLTTYQHMGQHSSCGEATGIAHSRPATPQEYAPLLRELTGIYHDCELKPVLRVSDKMRQERYRALERVS